MQNIFEIVSDQDGFIDPRKVAKMFNAKVGDVLEMSGAPSSAATKIERLNSAKNQSRLKASLEIINQVRPWAGSDLKAYAWYRSEPIPAFGGMTPEAMVKVGYSSSVKEYLSGLALGEYT